MSIDLKDRHEFQDRRAIIVSKDDKNSSCEHCAKNTIKDDGKRSLIRKFKIDDDIIVEGNKCDFMILNDDLNNAYLIELKGNDINHAIDQLEETYNKINAVLRGYEFFFRIVYKGNARVVKNPKVIRWQETCKKRVKNKSNLMNVTIIKNRKIEENI